MRIGLTIVLYLLLLTEGWAQWTYSGSNIYYNNGNVGIGTTTPSNIQGWDKVLDVSSPSCCTKIIATTSNATYRGGFFIHSTWHGGGGFVGTESNHNLYFNTNYDPKMVLTTSGNLGVGLLTPTQRLDVDGNINMTGVDRRLFMGGVAGTTFGIAYDAFNPNYGIFYTEASPDYVSISPNGDTNNGVVNVFGNGNVGIGTTTPDSKLTVKGTIHSQEVKVDLNGSVAPDYVFEKDYPLTSLEELKSYIGQNKHLPEIPSAKEMEVKGIELKEMNLMLLRKIEELTLYQIQLMEIIELQNERIKKIEAR